MLKPNECISEIAYRWVTDVVARHEFVINSVDYKQWPFSDELGLVSDFETARSEKGEQYAFDVFRPKATPFHEESLRHETNHTLIIEQERITERYQLEKLAHLILKNPDDAKKILHQFSSQKGSIIQSLSVRELLAKTEEELTRRKKNKNNIITIPDWPVLSKEIDGFERGRIATLGAVSGLGKTTLAINLAMSAAKEMQVLFVNQEMQDTDLGVRIISELTELTRNDLREGAFNAKSISIRDGFGPMFSNLTITDGKSLLLEQIVSLARYRKLKHGLNILIIDYDQKIKIHLKRGETEWGELLKVVEELESLAKELDIFVLLLAQTDDKGDQKASRRAIQPVSVYMNFLKTEEGIYAIELKKNRFGRNGIFIEVDYRPEISRVTEKGVWTPIERNKKRNLEFNKRNLAPDSYGFRY